MSRLYRGGDSYVKTFTISSSTGAAANADSTPAGTIYLNGAADAAAVTITNPATGVYKAAATLPGAAGDVVELLIAATVGGVVTKAVVDAVRLVAFTATDAVRLGLTALPNAAAAAAGGLPTFGSGAGQVNPAGGKVPATLAAADVTGTVAANLTQVGGVAIPTPAVAGVPKVDLTYANGVAVSSSDGTAQAGGAATITLAAGDAAGTNAYVDRAVTITGGTGAGQSRVIAAYNSTTKVATVHRAWDTNPDATSTYAIDPTAAANLVEWLGVAPNALISGKVDAAATVSAGSTAPAGWINAAAFAAGAIDATAFAQAAADKVWATGTRQLTATQAFNLTGNVTGNLSGSVGSVTGSVGSVTGAVGSVTAGVALTAAGLDAVIVEAGLNARQAFAVAVAGVSGVLSGAATTTITVKNPTGASNRIVATVDSIGNRSAIVLTPPI